MVTKLRDASYPGAGNYVFGSGIGCAFLYAEVFFKGETWKAERSMKHRLGSRETGARLVILKILAGPHNRTLVPITSETEAPGRGSQLPRAPTNFPALNSTPPKGHYSRPRPLSMCVTICGVGSTAFSLENNCGTGIQTLVARH
jgi:hypothetical protein